MGIQVRRTGSADYGRYIKALICGEPGAGKTLISSTFPNVLYASAEGGLMSVSDRDVALVDVKTSADLTELKQNLDQKSSVREKYFGGPIDTVVIDTIDEVARILQKERTTETKKETLAMADWGWFGDQLRGIIRGFRNLDMHVIFTCHVKTSEDGETGAMFVKPAIQGQVGDEIAGYVDLAVLLQARPHTEIVNGETRRSIQRYLQTFPDARHPWIKDRSGKLPMEFPVNFEDDYKRMDHLIYGGVMEQVVAEQAKAAEQTAALAEELRAGAVTQVGVPQEAPEPAQEKDQTPEPAADPTPALTLEEKMAAEDAKETEVAIAPAPAAVVPEEPMVSGPEPTEPFTTAHEELQASVPEVGTPPAAADEMACQSCGNQVENQDQKDLSMMRFRETLCRSCFVAKKKK